jgi:hypothetical protein
LFPDFCRFGASRARTLLAPIIPFVTQADQWPEPAENRPFPAVFGVLTEGTAIGG